MHWGPRIGTLAVFGELKLQISHRCKAAQSATIMGVLFQRGQWGLPNNWKWKWTSRPLLQFLCNAFASAHGWCTSTCPMLLILLWPWLAPFEQETFCDQSVTSKVIALHQGCADNIRCTRLLTSKSGHEGSDDSSDESDRFALRQIESDLSKAGSYGIPWAEISTRHNFALSAFNQKKGSTSKYQGIGTAPKASGQQESQRSH